MGDLSSTYIFCLVGFFLFLLIHWLVKRSGERAYEEQKKDQEEYTQELLRKAKLVWDKYKPCPYCGSYKIKHNKIIDETLNHRERNRDPDGLTYLESSSHSILYVSHCATCNHSFPSFSLYVSTSENLSLSKLNYKKESGGKRLEEFLSDIRKLANYSGISNGYRILESNLNVVNKSLDDYLKGES
jgi:hypothetical protein